MALCELSSTEVLENVLQLLIFGLFLQRNCNYRDTDLWLARNLAGCPRCEWPWYHYVDSDGFVFVAHDVGKTIFGRVEYDDYYLCRESHYDNGAKDDVGEVQ